MPRFMIERVFDDISDEEMREVAPRSHQIIEESFPEIEWERSHICAGPDGSIKSFCVYRAGSEEQIREHAVMLGNHAIAQLYEIVEDIDPSQFTA